MSESLEHLERLRDLGLFSWEEAQGHLIIVWKYLQGGWKEDGAQWCPVMGPEAMAQTGAQEVPSEHEETFLYCENDQILAQVAQGYGVSVLRDIPKPSGLGPGQLILGGPAQAGRLIYMIITGPFQLQLFCKSVRDLMYVGL